MQQFKAGHHRYSLINVHSSATTKQLWNDHQFPSLHYYSYIDMSTLFVLCNFQTMLVYNICHCFMSHASCFNSGSSAPSHILPRMTPVTYVHPTPPAPVHIRTSVPSRSQWYMWLFIVHIVYELLHCLWTHWVTFLQSAVMNSLLYCGHSMTLCLLHSR